MLDESAVGELSSLPSSTKWQQLLADNRLRLLTIAVEHGPKRRRGWWCNRRWALKNWEYGWQMV